jgi:inorganic triphosphatase YgiF
MTAPAAIPEEVEAKLLVPRPALLSAIARLKDLGPYRLRLRQTVRLHTIYLDTAEFTLARHGVALRLRRNRTRWEASIKWSGREDGIVHTRPELTVRLPRPPSFPFTVPAGPLATQLSVLVAGQPLTPILIADVHRQRRAVRVGKQGEASTFAELALDHVRLSAPGSRRRLTDTYCEIEIELEATGTTRDLLDFAELLRVRFALTPTEGSKFSRGLALLYGPGFLGTQPRAARKRARPPIAQQ